MFGWNGGNREEASTLFKADVMQADGVFKAAREMIADPSSADIGSLLRAFAGGVGTYADVSAFRFRQLADELGVACGYLSPGSSFFTNGWNLKSEVACHFCPDIEASILRDRDNTELEQTTLLESCPNEVTDTSWPIAIAGFMRRPVRFPLRAYRTRDATVYVDPFRYQIMSRDLSSMWETGSPRGLTLNSMLGAEAVSVSGNVIVVQDRFNFSNFCHFLYDAATRVGHYVDRFGSNGDTFIFGGIPGRYQQLVAHALAESLGLEISSFVFPTGKLFVRPTGYCTWFSDQKELLSHPGQMAHPTSLATLARVVDRIPAPLSNLRRLYISRGDAEHRTIVNESALIDALQKHGFTSVQLGNLPVDEQIGLFRGAEVIVGPHGMGLTHIAMGRNIGRMVELFHPTAGTDAYGFVARASGINYTNIFGKEIPATHSDFTIDVDQVLSTLAPVNIRLFRPNWKKATNLLPSSQTFRGFTHASPEPGVLWPGSDFDRMMSDQATTVHWKLDPPSNTNSGAWHGIEVTPGCTYTASCWVWLPNGWADATVSIRIDGVPSLRLKFANPSDICNWQRIYFSASIPPGITTCAIALHIEGEAGTGVVSTCWQFERSDGPSAYVPTI